MKLEACVLAALLLFATGASAQDDGGKLRIGVLTDLSSNNSDTAGMGSVEATRMAVEEVGGRVAGKPVEVVFADHQGKPDVGSSIARTWLDRDGVNAIVDVPQSAVALAIMPLVEKADAVALFSGAGAATISGKACSANAVQWTFDTYSLANSTGRALVAEGKDTWFFISSDYTFGQELERDTGNAVKAAGGKVLGAVRAPFNTADFSSYLLSAQSSGAKVVGLANAAADTRTSVIQAHEFGVTRNGTRLAALLLDVNDIRAIGLESAQGLYATSPFYWDRTEASRAWSRRFQARVGRMPSMIQAGVYSAVRHYLASVDAAQSIKGSVVVPEMRKLPVHDMFADSGTLREDGVLVHDMYLMRVKAPAASRDPWDMFEIVRTIPGEEAFRPLSASDCPRVKR